MIQSGKKEKKKLLFEKVTLQNSRSFSETTYRELQFDSSWHYHPEMELTFVSAGGGRVLIGSEWMTFSPGHLALIGSNTPHLYVSIPLENELTELRVVTFGEAFFPRLFELPEFAPVRTMLQSAHPALVIPDFPGGELFEKIHTGTGTEKMLSLLSLLAEMTKLPCRKINSPVRFSGKTANMKDAAILEKAIRFLQHNFNKPISLGDTARETGMTEETFRRFFKRHVFLSFSDYLLELRLTCACELLRESEYDIWEIAQRSGFRNLANFNRHFLARRHMQPREYRKL